MLGSQALENKFVLAREQLHRPIAVLPDGFALKMRVLKDEVASHAREWTRSSIQDRSQLVHVGDLMPHAVCICMQLAFVCVL